MPKLTNLVLTWTCGFMASLGLVVVGSGYFMDNYPASHWSAEVSKWIPPEGTVIQWRREGWASSTYWKWGVVGVGDELFNSRARALIWGDSFVEAFQVDDPDKLAQQTTRLLAATDLKDIQAVGIGESSASAADWYFGLEPYQRLLGPVCANVIIVANFEDFFPDEPSQTLSRFVSAPELAFLPNVYAPRSTYSDSMDFYYHWRLPALRKLRDRTIGAAGIPPIWQKLSLAVGPRPVRKKPHVEPRVNCATPDERQAAFSFALGKLREKSDAPLLIVYCPAVPRISQGSLVLEDEQSTIAREFQKACETAGISFLNMGGTFVEYFRRTNRFPRGFPSTRPGRGHFNAAGHALVAEAIVQDMHHLLTP